MNVVVVGNPKPMSRTRAAAELVATQLTGSAPSHVIDVIDLCPGVIGWGDPNVAEAKEIVKSASSLIVASPTFKGTYSGVLKLFLDQFGVFPRCLTVRSPEFSTLRAGLFSCAGWHFHPKSKASAWSRSVLLCTNTA